MDRRVSRAIQILKDHLPAPQLVNQTYRFVSAPPKINIGELAHRVGLSDARFRVVFKAETGLSPSQYKKSLEMEKVKELAMATDLPASQILEAVNVGDESHFRRNFKKANGITLDRYRKHGAE